MIQKKLIELSKVKVKKSGFNPHFKNKYYTLDDINDAYKDALIKNDISIVHQVLENKLITTITDNEDWTECKSELNIVNTDPQKRGLEITYYRRFNTMCLLNISEDDWDWQLLSEEKKQEKINDIVNEVKIKKENTIDLKIEKEIRELFLQKLIYHLSENWNEIKEDSVLTQIAIKVKTELKIADWSTEKDYIKSILQYYKQNKDVKLNNEWNLTKIYWTE